MPSGITCPAHNHSPHHWFKSATHQVAHPCSCALGCPLHSGHSDSNLFVVTQAAITAAARQLGAALPQQLHMQSQPRPRCGSNAPQSTAHGHDSRRSQLAAQTASAAMDSSCTCGLSPRLVCSSGDQPSPGCMALHSPPYQRRRQAAAGCTTMTMMRDRVLCMWCTSQQHPSLQPCHCTCVLDAVHSHHNPPPPALMALSTMSHQ
jgi:hypothetical protein